MKDINNKIKTEMDQLEKIWSDDSGKYSRKEKAEAANEYNIIAKLTEENEAILVPPLKSVRYGKPKANRSRKVKQYSQGGLLQDDETRMGYATGETVVDPMQETINNLMGLGISKKEIDIIRNNTVDSDAVRKIIVRTEKDMGVEPGNLFEAINMIAKKKEEREGMKDGGEFPDLNKDGEVTYADVLKGRGVFQEGGSIDDQMVMVMTPPMESEMESDDDMEDGYTKFIMEEALTEDEEDMLGS